MAFSFARSSGRIGDVARRGGRRIHGKYAFPFNAFRPNLHRTSIRAPYEVQGYRPVHRKRSDHGFKGNTPTQGHQGSGTEDRVVRKPKHLYKAAYVPPALLQQDVKDMYATLPPFMRRLSLLLNLQGLDTGLFLSCRFLLPTQLGVQLFQRQFCKAGGYFVTLRHTARSRSHIGRGRTVLPPQSAECVTPRSARGAACPQL